MTAAPVVRWAIKYVTHGFIDITTVNYLRTDAWRAFHESWGEGLPWSDPMNVKARRMRRKREVVAVRVEIREVTE